METRSVVAEMPTATSARQRYDAGEAELRAAESRLRAHREEENEVAGQLEELRSKRAQAVHRGDHAATDSFDAEILRADRAAERLRMLVAETAVSADELGRKVVLLGEELRREAQAARTKELESRGKHLVSAFNDEVWCRGHKLLAELYVVLEELRNLQAGHSAEGLQQSLIPNGNSLESQGWKLPRRHDKRFVMNAGMPPGESLPEPEFIAQPEPAAQSGGRLFYHPPSTSVRA